MSLKDQLGDVAEILAEAEYEHELFRDYRDESYTVINKRERFFETEVKKRVTVSSFRNFEDDFSDLHVNTDEIISNIIDQSEIIDIEDKEAPTKAFSDAERFLDSFIEAVYRRSIYRDENPGKVVEEYYKLLNRNREARLYELIILPEFKYFPSNIESDFNLRELELNELEVIYNNSQNNRFKQEIENLLERDNKVVAYFMNYAFKGKKDSEELIEDSKEFYKVSKNLTSAIRLQESREIRTTNRIIFDWNLKKTKLTAESPTYRINGIEGGKTGEGIDKDSWNQIEDLYRKIKKLSDEENETSIAIDRYLNAQHRPNLEDSFLDLYIALESILSLTNSDGKRDYAKRDSIALGDYSNYEKILEYVKIRNEIVHGSETDIDSKKHTEFAKIIRKLIVKSVKIKTEPYRTGKLAKLIKKTELDNSHDSIQQLIREFKEN